MNITKIAGMACVGLLPFGAAAQTAADATPIENVLDVPDALIPLIDPAPQPITPASIAAATFDGAALSADRDPLTVKLQILLDRADISPGIIDGIAGGMSTSAVAAFETREGFVADGVLDAEVWAALGGDSAAELTTSYTITDTDLAQVTGPTPQDYAEKAALSLLGYARNSEALAETFHMDEDFLTMLNPGAAFVPGEQITVAVTYAAAQTPVASIEIVRSAQRLVARAADGSIVANYPVAVGSASTPSPSGSYTVEGVAFDPTYTYDPDVNFQQGDNTEVLTIPPGPNGPVGTVWIDLSKPTYGIHGTPEPASLFSAQSHGCVRMTNWDAQELAALVSHGVTVDFVE